MSRPRDPDPFGLHRVRVRRRADTLAIPIVVATPSASPEPVAPPGEASGAATGGQDDALTVQGLHRRRHRSVRPGRPAGAPLGGGTGTGTDDERFGAPGERETESHDRRERDQESKRGADQLSWLAAAWRTVDPEALDHMLNAAHEMLRALRLLVDAADAVVEDQRRTRGRRGPRVRRIDLD